MEKFTGTVEKVDEMGKSVIVKGKDEKTFAGQRHDKDHQGQRHSFFGDLKQDMHVAIEFKKDGDKMVAASIKASAPKAAKKEKPAKEKTEKPAEAPKK